MLVYGTARDVAGNPTGRTEQTAVEQGYQRSTMVTVVVTPTRIYAIRPPKGHPAG